VPEIARRAEKGLLCGSSHRLKRVAVSLELIEKASLTPRSLQRELFVLPDPLARQT
jgi:hypothetical protein